MRNWKDVEGYEGIYQVSYSGKVRRIYKNGKIKELKPYTKPKTGSIQYVGLARNGIKKEVRVHKIVARAFLGAPKDGQVVYHINGMLGRLTGARSRRKGVAKINVDGEIVEFYPSARQAARSNFMSYQTVIDRCNGKVKGPFAPDGYAYAWEDCHISISNSINKIKLSRGVTYEKN